MSEYVTQLSNVLIMQLNIWKYDFAISKVIPNLIIDQEISLWGNRMLLVGVIYHLGEHSHCGHYTSGVKLQSTWLLISNRRVLKRL